MILKYVEDNFTIVFRDVPVHDGRHVDGYGKKIATHRMIRFDDHPRLYRVYAVCFSNLASHYIIRKGEILYIRDSDLTPTT